MTKLLVPLMLPLVYSLSVSGFSGPKTCSGGIIQDGVQICTATIKVGCGAYCAKYLFNMDNSTHGTFACSEYGGQCPSCFDSNTPVLRDQVLVPMKEIRVGDLVADGPGSVSRVIGFLHRDENADVEMLKFFSDDGSYLFTVSPKHLLSDEQGQFRFAHRFTKGSSLKRANGDFVIVGAVEVVRVKGLYAPLTESGTLGVGSQNVLASCYANVENHNLAHLWVKWTGAGADGQVVEPRVVDEKIAEIYQWLAGE